MARTTNYDNRRVSLSIYSQLFNYQSTEEQLAPTTLNGDSGGFVCAGIVKLCQSVLIFLLSDDLIFDSTWGSAIPRYMNGSVQYFASNLESVVQSAFNETITELRFNEKTDAPDDERISALELVSWDYIESGTGVTITIQVTSVAGEQRDVVVPLNITV